MEPFRDPFQVVPEPVSYQERFPSHTLDDVLQCIQFPVMDGDDLSIICVYRTIRHLRELPGKGCGIGGGYFPVRELQQKIPLEGNIALRFLLREIHLIAGGNELWHLQVICGFHGDRDVGDQPVDLFLCTWKGLVGEHHLPIAFVRQEKPGAVLADEPPKPLSHIQQLDTAHRSISPLLLGVPVSPTTRPTFGRTFIMARNRLDW